MQKSRLWNSISNDRPYNADDITAIHRVFVGNGVFVGASEYSPVYAAGESLRCIVGTALQVSVKPGHAFCRGCLYTNDSDFVYTLDPASGVTNRTDSIVVRWIKSERDMKLALKTGDTSVVRTDAIFELQIATIAVLAGTVQLLPANIFDKRGDASVCGWVSNIVDTAGSAQVIADATVANRLKIDMSNANLQALAISLDGAYAVKWKEHARFTASGIWVCPNGVTQIRAVIVASGGYGGTGRENAGGGGGAGEIIDKILPVTPGESYSIVIGGHVTASSAFGLTAQPGKDGGHGDRAAGGIGAAGEGGNGAANGGRAGYPGEMSKTASKYGFGHGGYNGGGAGGYEGDGGDGGLPGSWILEGSPASLNHGTGGRGYGSGGGGGSTHADYRQSGGYGGGPGPAIVIIFFA